MRALLIAALSLNLLATAVPVQAQQVNLLNVELRSQLLLDPSIVWESNRIAFTLHPGKKHPDNPLMTADQPWEGSYVSAFAGTVLHDKATQSFKMWYTCGENPEYFGRRGICYATSRDGLKWEKPHVGLREAKNGQPHNCLLAIDTPSVFFDRVDPDPARRYKMIGFDIDRGYMSFISRDGIGWSGHSTEPIVPISYVDDVISAFRDPRTGEFVALPKMMTPVMGRSRRSIYLTSSFDFRHWSKPEPAFFADRRDDLGTLARVERVRRLLRAPDNMKVMRTEFYGAGAYVAESCTIGFPWVFSVSANVPLPGNQDGPIEVQIAVSRDRETWSRPFRTPIIPLSPPGEWDSGMILTASQAIDVGDEVWLYYGGHNCTHGGDVSIVLKSGQKPPATGAIGLATWKKDRFASADGPAEGGTLTTVPLAAFSQRLELNAATKPNGTVRVELLDAAGVPLKDFSLSKPITGDSLRHMVEFPGVKDLKSLAGQPICLRFHLQDAQLFAFAFRH